MNSFQAKIGWKMMRKTEIKIFVPFRSYPTNDRKFQKNSKIKRYHHMASFQAFRLEKSKNERK